MAKRIGLIAIILIICFSFFIAVRVPAQTVRPLAGSKNNQTGKQEKQDKRAYLLRARETHKIK